MGHVDFTSFHRYEININGADTSFFVKMLNKIISSDPQNMIYQAYVNGCVNCFQRSNCPVYWNYKKLVENEQFREYVINVFVKAIIKGNLSPSVREINDFYYEIIVGRTFDETLIMSKSINRLKHFIENLTLWLLYESEEGVLQYTAREDVFRDVSRKCDEQIISLNLKPNFEFWLQNVAAEISPIFIQIFNDILYCKNNKAKRYKDHEQDIKQAIFKLYIRYTNFALDQTNGKYQAYLKYLFYYNIGAENKCKDIIQLIEECVYLWNGRLGGKTGTNVKNGVIVSRSSSKFYLYKKMFIKFARNIQIVPVDLNSKISAFSSVMSFGFKLKDGKTIVSLEIDYDLYSFLLDIKSGFIPTNTDRKHNVKYDTFVRKLIAESDSDFYVYARGEEGRTYRIAKDDFDSYTFDYEV